MLSKIKIIEAVEAIVAVIGLILLIGEIFTEPKAVVGLILVALAAVAFYVTHNIALGKTPFLGREKTVEKVEEKKTKK